MCFCCMKVHYRVDFTIVIFEEAWNDVSLSKFGETLKRTFENRGNIFYISCGLAVIILVIIQINIFIKPNTW